MRSRAALVVVGAAALAVAAALLLRGGGASRPTRAAPGGADPTRATAASDHAAGAKTADRPLRRPPGSAARGGAVTVGGVTLEGAGVYDPDADDVKANLFEFKKSRLRFALYDAAADCWAGGDDVADVQVAYTLVVEAETLRLEHVRMLDSTLPDPAIEQCILGRLAELRSPAADIPDLREDGSSWISLHDLYTRNRRGR